MKRGMLKKILCIMMVMVMCLTSISLTAFADEGGELIPEEKINDPSICKKAADGKHVRNNDGFGQVIESPTCTEAGKCWMLCGLCGQQYLEVLPAKGHEKIVTKEAVEATCTKEGNTEEWYCKVCDYKEASKVIPAGHTVVVDPKVEATCTEDGLTEGSHCSVCGEKLKAQEVIPATGEHTVVVDPRVEVTCTKDGLTEGSHCSVCGEKLKAQEVIPATGHTKVQKTLSQEGTCLTPEKWTIQCLIDKSFWEEIGTYGPHKWIDVVLRPATCTEAGLTGEIRCDVCGKIREGGETIPALGHDYSERIEPAGEDGYFKISECSRCGDMIAKFYQKMSPEDSNCIFKGEDGKELTKISDKLQFFTNTSDDGAKNLLYADNTVRSRLRELSAESEDGIHNLAAIIGESGSIQMNSPDGTKQMGISMSLIDWKKALVLFNENNSPATVTDIKQAGNSVILESENGNELTFSSENVKYEVGDIDESDDSYIVAERVEGEENTVRLSTQSADTISEEQKESETEESEQTEETTTDDAADTTEVYEAVEIVFGIHDLKEEVNETNTGTDNGKIEQFTEEDNEDEKVEKLEEESPSFVIIKYEEPEQSQGFVRENNNTFVREAEEIVSIDLTYNRRRCANGKYTLCEMKKKDDNVHRCKNCGQTAPHYYEDGKCVNCGFKHKKHSYQYVSLDGKDKCICGKTVSHEWKDNKKGYCVCKMCGHKVAHTYENKKCIRCGAKTKK